MADINYWYFAIPVASVAVIYIIRRIRVWQWGRIRNRYSLAGKTFISIYSLTQHNQKLFYYITSISISIHYILHLFHYYILQQLVFIIFCIISIWCEHRNWPANNKSLGESRCNCYYGVSQYGTSRQSHWRHSKANRKGHDDRMPFGFGFV